MYISEIAATPAKAVFPRLENEGAPLGEGVVEGASFREDVVEGTSSEEGVVVGGVTGPPLHKFSEQQVVHARSVHPGTHCGVNGGEKQPRVKMLPPDGMSTLETCNIQNEQKTVYENNETL